jgi:hypothetical protein
MDAVDARRLTLAPEQDEQPAISKAAPLVGEIAQPGTKLRVRRATRALSDHLPIRPDDTAGSTFRQAHHGPKMRDGIAAASNICSASSFFSLALSSSNCFSLLTSETVDRQHQWHRFEVVN